VSGRVLLVVGADAARENGAPRRDYDVVARAVGATILDRHAVDDSLVARLIRRFAGVAPAQAWLAFRRRGQHDVILTDGEHVAIPLAILLRLGRSRIRHVTIGHRLSSPKKRLFLRTLRAHDRIDKIALHSRHQYEFALGELGIPASRLALVPYHVDTRFWSPRDVEPERLVVSAGLEHRDYSTLMRAARGLNAEFVIGAASHWSRHGFSAEEQPVNVRVGSFDYRALRDLYARAALVVVPLHDVDNQAGVTTILEAMAMGKAVVVTQSVGQTDVVEDRRRRERGVPRARPESLIGLLASEHGLAPEPNGFYVPPGDPDALRRAITYLLDHPAERERLGRAGRSLVERILTVEQFADRIRDLLTANLEVDQPAAPIATLQFS
jgi:glycosyltransferase involved in cell wall biosynthesis